MAAGAVGTVGATLAIGAATWLVMGLIPGVGWDLYTDPVAKAVEEELGEIHAQVEELESEVSRLEDREARLRALAGLADPELGPLADVSSDPWDRGHHLFWLPPRQGDLEAAAVDETAARLGIHELASRARALSGSMDGVSDSLNARRTRMRATPSLLPASGFVSSGYSYSREHPIHQEARPHTGVDLAAPHGTPIRAAAAGEVHFAGHRTGYGRVVQIDHDLGYRTLYGHASELHVEEGDWVERGEVIAAVGSTGTATSPHLHYEVHVDGRPVDPQEYLASNPTEQ